MAHSSFIRVPPDGAGKKVYTREHTVDVDVVQAHVNHLVDKDDASHILRIDQQGAANVRFAEGQPIMSGFGGLKTTGQRALGVYESSIDTYRELFSLYEENGGTITYSSESSSEILAVNTTANAKSAMVTNRYHYYLPGTSNFINMTVSCGDTGKLNNSRKWGAFDANDGVYFELDDSIVYVVIRSSTTGSVVETRVPQSAWNADKADGTGLSGATLDITKINVWWIDYQWLGAGRVRFGLFSPEGARIVCHEFRNAGQNSLPYMRTGTLPLAVENSNHGVVGAGSEMRVVCMAIYAEGTYEDYTFWRHSAGTASHTVSVQDQFIAAIRSIATVNGKHNSVIAYPENFNLYSDQPFELSFWQNVAITGGTWVPLDGLTLEATTAGTPDYTNARRFKSFFLPAGVSMIDMTKFFEVNDEGIQRNSDGTANNWVVTASPLSASPAVTKMNINYRELW